MATHVHFHDFLQSDRKPFNEANVKRSHGKFSRTRGPGAENPGLKERKPPGTAKAGVHARPKQQPQPASRLQTIRQGAAAKVAQALQKAKQQAEGLGSEAFAVPHDLKTLTEGFDKSSSEPRRKIGTQAAKNVGRYLKEMSTELGETIYHAGKGLTRIPQGIPMLDKEQEAWKSLGRKFVISTLMRSMDVAVPGSGLLAEAAGHAVGHVVGHVAQHVGEHAVDHATQHVIEQIAEHVTEHAADEHLMKLGGTGTRLAHRSILGSGALFGRQRRLQQQRQMSRHDHAYRDADPSQEEIMKACADWLHTVAESIITAPIPMKQILATMPKPNGKGDKASPLFGGLGGNNPFKDEGTSEGARKGWLHRHGPTRAKPELRKMTRPAEPPKPETPKTRATFEQMRARKDYVPPPMPKAKSPQRVPNQPHAPKPHEQDILSRRAAAPVTTERRSQAPTPTLVQPLYGQGEQKRTGSTRKSTQTPYKEIRENVSMTQREREGPAREQQASTAKSQIAELKALHGRRTSLTPKETDRMNRLIKEHGLGAIATPTAQGTAGPPKRFLQQRGGRRWLSRKR
jgi:hypothetical protein